MGVIDTLSAGLDLVRRKPWLMLLPVALNIAIWFAPRLSVAAPAHRLLGWYMAQVTAYPGSIPPDILEATQEQVRVAEQLAKSLNLGILLTWGYLDLPATPVADTTTFFGQARPVLEIQHALAVPGIVAGLMLAGLLMGTLYRAPVAALVRGGDVDWGALGRRLPRYWLRLLGAAAVTTAALLTLALPLACVASLGLLVPASLLLALPVMWFLQAAILLATIFLAFLPQAILYGDDGVLTAIGNSMRVARHSFWQTIGLFLLIIVITLGLGFVWERLTTNALGALLAIVANAFVGTGLMAATFIFYRDRLQAWQQSALPARS